MSINYAALLYPCCFYRQTAQRDILLQNIYYTGYVPGISAGAFPGLFIDMISQEEDGVPPKKPQGKFALRLDPETYYAASVAAAAEGESLNQWIARAVHDAAMNYARG